MRVTDYTWEINGIDLGQWCILAGSLWRPPVSVRRTTLVVPGLHGSIAAGPIIYEEPTLSLEFGFLKESQTEVETTTNDLIGVLASHTLTVARTSGALKTYADAKLISISPSGFFAGKHAKLTAALAVPSVFFYQYPTASTPIVAQTALSNQTVANLTGSTAPVVNAVVKIRGPFSWFEVVDAVSQTGLSWAGPTIGSTEYLYMDAETLTAWRTTAADAFTFGAGTMTDVTSGLNYPPAGPLQLWPAIQSGDASTRQVRVNVNGTGQSTTTAVTIYAGRSYL